MKLYIFDDNVLISGANLSDSYFTDRTDRYFLFKNCKPLADFFHEIVTTVGDSSFIVESDQVVPSPKCDVHPYLGGSQTYRNSLKQRVENVIEKYRESRKSESSVSETMIYPVLQMGLLGVHQEFNLLKKLFAVKDDEMKMTMASGYFNFIKDYEDLILNEGTYQLDILTASPFANGFFESRGFSKYIPPLYSNISEQFLTKQLRSNRMNVRMHQYFREGWTFHAKGIWTEHENKIMTLVGSSNYGYRSVHRDLEAQVMVVTSDKMFMNRLREEKTRLFECSSLLDMVALQQPEHHIPPIVRVISRLVRSFL
uniref:CDP-diacylglycerol--glycerol-3-phosphate 3-phosphatidyltransferase n=1 Tax=Caenorhabditis tropicalis TaxID=1561998 RepID=A0A1I7TEE3_9PELO